ncbi:MAG TPA: hypothetical protein VGO50_21045 [Pyrinomonadaceae bacterium]|jgi:hypothetical protein|nr:hypothetical protein [Pyrinomonadaceae bacterium]
MSKFTIITRGIAASYRKDDNWKLLFPFNECHQVRLQLGGVIAANNSDNNGNDGGIPLGQRGVKIEISVTDPQTKTCEGDNYCDFVDLTAEGVHGAMSARFPMDEMNAVLMSIGNAKFSALDHLSRRYRLVDQSCSEAVTPFQDIGNSGKAEIEGGELTIRVTGLSDGSFSMVFSDDATIVFDNDCYEQPMSKKGDLEMLYDIISDADKDSVRFRLEAEPVEIAEPATAGANGGAAAAVSAAGSAGAGLDSVDAPLRNPALDGGEGLPCNKFRISNPRSLP